MARSRRPWVGVKEDDDGGSSAPDAVTRGVGDNDVSVDVVQTFDPH